MKGRFDALGGGEDINVKTYNYEGREYLTILNQRGLLRGYKDIYGKDLTSADLEALGLSVSEFDSTDAKLPIWKRKVQEVIDYPAMHPNANKPYHAMMIPNTCDSTK